MERVRLGIYNYKENYLSVLCVRQNINYTDESEFAHEPIIWNIKNFKLLHYKGAGSFQAINKAITKISTGTSVRRCSYQCIGLTQQDRDVCVCGIDHGEEGRRWKRTEELVRDTSSQPRAMPSALFWWPPYAVRVLQLSHNFLISTDSLSHIHHKAKFGLTHDLWFTYKSVFSFQLWRRRGNCVFIVFTSMFLIAYHNMVTHSVLQHTICNLLALKE